MKYNEMPILNLYYRGMLTSNASHKTNIPDLRKTRKQNGLQSIIQIDVERPPKEIIELQSSNRKLSNYIDVLWATATPARKLKSPFRDAIRSNPMYPILLNEYPILREYNNVIESAKLNARSIEYRYIKLLVHTIPIIFELHMDETFLIMRAIGTGDSIYKYAKEPIQLGISDKDEIIIDRIRKSTMPRINSGKKAMKMALAITAMFKPKYIVIQDNSTIHCDANNSFSLSWFRFIASNELERSWYNSFGLELANDTPAIKTQLRKAQQNIQGILCGDIANYCNKLLDCVLDPSFESNNIYFVFKDIYQKIIISNYLQVDIAEVQSRLSTALEILKEVPTDTTLKELYINHTSCHETSTIFSCLPCCFYDNCIPFLFIDDDKKMVHVFPKLHDFLLVSPHIAGLRTYLASHNSHIASQ